jgi:hypothetical protein
MEYIESVQHHRAEKDKFFFSGHPQSPFTGSAAGQSLKHLDYYPINPAYKFKVPLRRKQEVCLLY